MIFMIIFSKGMLSINVGFILIIAFAALVNSLLFAPMQEVGIKDEISGAAISLVSFVGYLPLVFCYSLYGSILDKFQGVLGYKILFTITMCFGLVGLLVNRKLIENSRVKEKM